MRKENEMNYRKSQKYTDYYKIYEQCAGPGGLKLAEHLAEMMSLKSGKKLIDIGFFKGYQTCFLAKEYNVDIVGIEPGCVPWEPGIPNIEHLMKNARDLGVADKVLGVQSGLPNTLLPCNYFDYAYTTSCLEMIRGNDGEEAYHNALIEIYRILKNGGVLGLAEPMNLEVTIPDDVAPLLKVINFDKHFVTLEKTKKAILEVGFKIMESGYAEDAQLWWDEYLKYDPGYGPNPEREQVVAFKKALKHGLSFGYIIAVK